MQNRIEFNRNRRWCWMELCAMCERLRLTTDFNTSSDFLFLIYQLFQSETHSENWKRKMYTENHLIWDWCVFVLFLFFAYVNNIFVCELQLAYGHTHSYASCLLSAFEHWILFNSLLRLQPSHALCVVFIFCLFRSLFFVCRSLSFHWPVCTLYFYKCESNVGFIQTCYGLMDRRRQWNSLVTVRCFLLFII